MSARSARIGAGFLALVAVWIGVYWLWEPTGAPRMSFADEPQQSADTPEQPARSASRPVEAAPDPAEGGLGEDVILPVRSDDPAVPNTDVAGAVPTPPYQTYTVQPRDNFERISRKFYNTIRHADAIAAANPFVSPTALRVGQMLRIPTDPDNVQGRPAEGESSDLLEPEFIEYTVVKNDNLSGLAQRFYGSLRYADVIFNANRDTMDSIDDLQIGQVLRIPSRANVLGDDREDNGG